MNNLNPYTRKTQHFVERNMMLVQNHSWEPEGDNGKGDSIGRTVLSFIAYKYNGFVLGIRSCFQKERNRKGKLFLQGYRHQDYKYDVSDISRDHITYAFILEAYLGNIQNIRNLMKGLRWKISDRYSMTIDMWLWIRMIAGYRLAGIAWYIISIPMMLTMAAWNGILYKTAKLGPERRQDLFNISICYQQNLSSYQKWARGVMFPMYALHILAWQLYVARPSAGRSIMHRILRLMVSKENLLVSMLIGRKVEKETIDQYKPMSSYRWSTRLDKTNDRDIYILEWEHLTDSNNLDKDILYRIYKETQL